MIYSTYFSCHIISCHFMLCCMLCCHFCQDEVEDPAAEVGPSRKRLESTDQDATEVTYSRQEVTSSYWKKKIWYAKSQVFIEWCKNGCWIILLRSLDKTLLTLFDLIFCNASIFALTKFHIFFMISISELFVFKVIRGLRERGEPIRLFGETNSEAFYRLRRIEMLAPEVNKVSEALLIACHLGIQSFVILSVSASVC